MALERFLAQSPAQTGSNYATVVYSGCCSLVLKTSSDGDCIISLHILFHSLVVLMMVGKKD